MNKKLEKDSPLDKKQLFVILFGLPGAGKTFVGEVFRDKFDFFFHDGDEDLPDDMRQAIEGNKVLTDRMRDKFFKRLIERVEQLIAKHKALVLAQTFIEEKYRKLMISNFPEVRFILVETNTSLREMRLERRTRLRLDKAYARKMTKIFENPQIKHLKIINDVDGSSQIKRQIKSLFRKV